MSRPKELTREQRDSIDTSLAGYCDGGIDNNTIQELTEDVKASWTARRNYAIKTMDDALAFLGGCRLELFRRLIHESLDFGEAVKEEWDPQETIGDMLARAGIDNTKDRFAYVLATLAKIDDEDAAKEI